MTKLQRMISAVAIAWLFTYAMLAFIFLEANPTLWSRDGRLGFCWLGLCLSWIGGGLPYFLFKDK